MEFDRSKIILKVFSFLPLALYLFVYAEFMKVKINKKMKFEYRFILNLFSFFGKSLNFSIFFYILFFYFFFPLKEL
jgi:hypothetical protein